jgi:uncharacterized protein (TIGR04255 family)
MSDILSKSGHFDPIHSAHSIEQVIFVVQMERPLNDAEFSIVRQKALQFRILNDLPAIMEHQGLAFGMGIGSLTPMNGFTLSRIGPDGTVEKELRIERNSVTFRSLLYSRWVDTWTQVQNYFDQIVPMFFDSNKITGVSLNFIDKFVWSGDPEKCNIGSLLRPESKYISPNVFEAKDLWHSHTGAFIRVDGKTKRLLNVNVDSLDDNQPEGSRRAVVIATVLTDLLNQPGYEPFDLNKANAMVGIETKIQTLHVFGKEVFSNILNEEMSKRIALID